MQTFLIIILSAFSLITLVAAFILTRGLFTECVEKVQATLENNWKRSFWIGLLNTILISIFVFGLGALGNSVGLFYIPTFGIYGAFLIGLLFGMTAFTQILGDRLFSDSEPVKKGNWYCNKNKKNLSYKKQNKACKKYSVIKNG